MKLSYLILSYLTDYAALDATQAAHVADVITQVDAHHGDACVPPSAAARPNILMVLVDDLGKSLR